MLLNILFDKVDRGLQREKKHFVRYHWNYCFLKTVAYALNQWLVVTPERKKSLQKKMTKPEKKKTVRYTN